MREQKTHVNINGKPACGVHSKRKLIFATEPGSATCKRCKKAIEK
jgi:hypothetical protein